MQAQRIINSWGFTYKSIGFVWAKTTKSGQPAFGIAPDPEVSPP